jgi:hypothetical protein
MLAAIALVAESLKGSRLDPSSIAEAQEKLQALGASVSEIAARLSSRTADDDQAHLLSKSLNDMEKEIQTPASVVRLRPANGTEVPAHATAVAGDHTAAGEMSLCFCGRMVFEFADAFCNFRRYIYNTADNRDDNGCAKSPFLRLICFPRFLIFNEVTK